MLVLAIDTSSAAVLAAVAEVVDDVVIRAERVPVNAKAHGELLAPSVDECLTAAGIEPGGLGAIVAGLGPGPFTGLRVGLVTAAAMSDALGVPSYGVCSLDAIAGAVPAEGGPLLVVTDARRKEVYWAAYRDGQRVEGPAVCPPAELPAAPVAVGAGAELYADVLRGNGIEVREAPYPSAAALVRCAADRIRAGAPSEQLVPLYLRRPDAVPPGATKTVSQ